MERMNGGTWIEFRWETEKSTEWAEEYEKTEKLYLFILEELLFTRISYTHYLCVLHFLYLYQQSQLLPFLWILRRITLNAADNITKTLQFAVSMGFIRYG